MAGSVVHGQGLQWHVCARGHIGTWMQGPTGLATVKACVTWHLGNRFGGDAKVCTQILAMPDATNASW